MCVAVGVCACAGIACTCTLRGKGIESMCSAKSILIDDALQHGLVLLVAKPFAVSSLSPLLVLDIAGAFAG